MSTIPTSQLGVFIESAAPSYTVKELAVAKPVSGQVLIKIHAVAVNPTDWKIVKFGVAKPGFGIGNDFAGEVVALGADVKGFSIGDRVAGWVHGGFQETQFAFQEYLPARSDLLMKIPPNVSYEEAATIPVASTTAAIGMNRLVQFPQRPPLGKTILVSGGASSVGMFVIQFASLTGMRVIATASPKNFDLVKSLGASAVIDYHAPDAVQQILDAAGPAGVDYAYDAISFGDSVKIASEVVKAKKEGARRVAVVLPIPPATLDPLVEYHPVGIQTIFNIPFQFLGVNIPPIPADYETALITYRTLNDWLSKEIFKANPVMLRENGIKGIPEGITDVMSGKVSGSKLVFKV
ncbi:GroES-like protein [Dendrothele bispora CBS 962.96]|uniref:GroES-like protein n=1 Tax=Dendrothele bispora (strain CBS 962.96) TaxID=1314807 RepID=A0A4S8L787_DENBC|nr:GroES-like protein [Dendrothele bispora CBS 962.96]